jgi:thiamine phosphate synthase YjbQ (UPF0047 family)
MHITAAIIVNDDKSDLPPTLPSGSKKLAPANPAYRHHWTGDASRNAGSRCCITRSRYLSRLAASTWGRGSQSFTLSLTANGASG